MVALLWETLLNQPGKGTFTLKLAPTRVSARKEILVGLHVQVQESKGMLGSCLFWGEIGGGGFKGSHIEPT